MSMPWILRYVPITDTILVKVLRADDRPNGRILYWYCLPATKTQRHFRCWGAISTWKYASYKPHEAAQSLRLSPLTFYYRCKGLYLKFFLKKNRFRIWRNSPDFLGFRKKCTVKNKCSFRSGTCFILFFSNKSVSLSRICLACHRNL